MPRSESIKRGGISKKALSFKLSESSSAAKSAKQEQFAFPYAIAGEDIEAGLAIAIGFTAYVANATYGGALAVSLNGAASGGRVFYAQIGVVDVKGDLTAGKAAYLKDYDGTSNITSQKPVFESGSKYRKIGTALSTGAININIGEMFRYE